MSSLISTDMAGYASQLVTVNQAQESLVSRGIDITKSGYRTSGFLIGDVAQGIGMHTRQLDFDHWVVAQGIFRALDTMIDEEGMLDLADPVKQLSNGDAVGEHVTSAEATIFAQVLDEFDEERRQEHIIGLTTWPRLENAKRNAQNIESYADAIRTEANRYANLLRTVEPEASDWQGRRRAVTNDWIQKYITGAYFIDAAHDMNSDYTSARCRVAPTFRDRMRLAKLALTEGGIEAARIAPVRSYSRIGTLILRYGVK